MRKETKREPARRGRAEDAPRKGSAPGKADAPRKGSAADKGSAAGKIRARPRPAETEKAGGERIAKIMARAGLCSRRDAEAWIAAGRVAVNGKVLTSPALALGPRDRIEIDGKPLAPRERTRLFLFHKPRGLVTTDRDPEGRATVFDHLRAHWPGAPRLVSIGRLDINTEGLLLLTNDGGLARVLELPATGWLRRYRVRANGITDQAKLDGLAGGVSIEGMDYAGIEAVLDRVQGANSWMTLGLREGKNREVKRVLDYLGLAVNRLIRLSYGPFQLGDLPEGALEEVRTRVLRDQLGPSLAAAAGADFDGPILEEALRPPEPPRADRRAPPARGTETRPKHGDRHPPAPERPGKPERGPRKHVSGLREAVPAPRSEPPPPEQRSRPARGPRKHVSVLREAAAATPATRKRRAESTTEDRKGRRVAVERLEAAHPTPQPKSRGRRTEGAVAGSRKSRDAAHAGKAQPRQAAKGRVAQAWPETKRMRDPARDAGKRPNSAKPGSANSGKPNKPGKPPSRSPKGPRPFRGKR